MGTQSLLMSGGRFTLIGLHLPRCEINLIKRCPQAAVRGSPGWTFYESESDNNSATVLGRSGQQRLLTLDHMGHSWGGQQLQHTGMQQSQRAEWKWNKLQSDAPAAWLATQIALLTVSADSGELPEEAEWSSSPSLGDTLQSSAPSGTAGISGCTGGTPRHIPGVRSR